MRAPDHPLGKGDVLLADENVSLGFGGVKALTDVSLSISPGSYTVLLGPSGSGKTTLLSILGGFLVPTGGRVFISGEDIQIHGGVGFTWDCDAHLYYKRAKMNDAMLGYQGWQRRRLADLVLDSA